MARIFERAIDGPATHAFLVGVGDYPFAKPGKGKLPELRAVRDLPSAADGARLMCDWLIENRDRLAAPLASIELLVSDPPATQNRYQARSDELKAATIERATGPTLIAGGQRWIEALKSGSGHTALFYGCGHGASLAKQPVLFLSDLNERDEPEAWSHFHVGKTGLALRQMAELRAAFMFVDACGEFVRNFQLADVQDHRFVSPRLPRESDRDKVWLVSAASSGLLAYDAAQALAPDLQVDFEGDYAKGGVRIGRFTQTLLKGLDGASARWLKNRWTVDNRNLSVIELKKLQRHYFPEWKDRTFEPSDGLTANDQYALVHPESPALPVQIQVNPEQAATSFDLRICLTGDGAPPWVRDRGARMEGAWLTEVAGDTQRPYFIVASDGISPHSTFFKADQPQWDQWINVS
ncbi:hypothetical protein C0V72_09075 [Porphyrobacter sp. TH134]|uniref:hypothetical protein n=1 Tax=Porphyrobacter sp. TH134 TaxID=2067450 RepID=UPI000C7A6D5B|nr:hypothetical protein [Porphyrobacter sp. TH134]PLK23539.1 hypothetical protein C0V72_09075 [Porphyrobacter sp. TH134]